MIPQVRSIIRQIPATLMSLLALTVFVCSCSPGEEMDLTTRGQRPNIIMVISDDHTHAQMSIAGIPMINTPNLDSLGNEGVWFKNAF